MVTMLKMQDAQHFIDSVAKHIPSTNREDIHIEGLVYNMSQEAVLKRLENILGAVDYRRLIRQFMEETDGDFVITLRLRNGKTAVFNDKWGRLPIYYVLDSMGFLCSRSISTLMEMTGYRKINQTSLTELLSIGQVLGERTLLDNICYLLPASLLESNGSEVKVRQLIPTDFEEPRKVLSRKECIDRCVELFLESVQNRASVLSSMGYELYADLSGGRDTRAVFGALNVLGFKPTPITIGFCKESETAAKIANLYGANLTLTPEPIVNINSAAPLVYKDNCIVDYYTVLLVYAEKQFKQNIVKGKKAVDFMGLGGEFIRHPYRIPKQYHSVESAIDDGLIRHYFTIYDACKITGMPIAEFKKHLREHFAAYPESTMAGKTRHMYFEYYNREVNSGEDRMRDVYWVTCPLWGRKLFDFEKSAIPDEYIDDSFFCDFIKAIDPKLMEIPFFAPAVDIHRNDGWAKFIRRKLIKSRQSSSVATHNELETDIRGELLKLEANKDCFDSKGVASVMSNRNHSIWHQRQLMATIMYAEELERHGIKRTDRKEKKTLASIAYCAEG